MRLVLPTGVNLLAQSVAAFVPRFDPLPAPVAEASSAQLLRNVVDGVPRNTVLTIAGRPDLVVIAPGTCVVLGGARRADVRLSGAGIARRHLTIEVADDGVATLTHLARRATIGVRRASGWWYADDQDMEQLLYCRLYDGNVLQLGEEIQIVVEMPWQRHGAPQVLSSHDDIAKAILRRFADIPSPIVMEELWFAAGHIMEQSQALFATGWPPLCGGYVDASDLFRANQHRDLVNIASDLAAAIEALHRQSVNEIGVLPIFEREPPPASPNVRIFEVHADKPASLHAFWEEMHERARVRFVVVPGGVDRPQLWMARAFAVVNVTRPASHTDIALEARPGDTSTIFAGEMWCESFEGFPRIFYFNDNSRASYGRNSRMYREPWRNQQVQQVVARLFRADPRHVVFVPHIDEEESR